MRRAPLIAHSKVASVDEATFIGELANTKRLPERNQYRIARMCLDPYPLHMTNSNLFSSQQRGMRMSLPRKNRSYLTITALAASIAVNAPIATASATSITDLVFPETVPVPTTKPDHLVTGSVPRIASEAPEAKRIPAAQETPSERQRVSNAKEPKR